MREVVFDNISLEALHVGSDAAAASVLTFGMNTEDVNTEGGNDERAALGSRVASSRT